MTWATKIGKTVRLTLTLVLLVMFVVAAFESSHGVEYCTDCCDTEICHDCLLGKCCGSQTPAITRLYHTGHVAVATSVEPGSYTLSPFIDPTLYPPEQPPRPFLI